MSEAAVLFIGAGNMGLALMEGIASSGKTKILFVENDSSRAEELSCQAEFQHEKDLGMALSKADTIFLAVKPQSFAELAEAIHSQNSGSKTFVSIMAGVTLEKMACSLGSNHTLVRTMPNIPVLAGKGAIAIATDGLKEQTLAAVENLLEHSGESVRVKESMMDAVTGLSGSGPAYVFLFADGLVQGGIKAGLPRDVAQKLAYATIRGGVAMLQEPGSSPGELTARVTSPGGTTIYGLHALEEAGFRSTLMRAVENAANRSRELGG